MKVTAVAPANIAFIKYWGRKDEELRIPVNSSISMNLSNLSTKTTVEFSSKLRQDMIFIDNNVNHEGKNRVIKHLDRIRKIAGLSYKAKVVSLNSFPTSTGLSSSASGFAALTLATCSALGLKLTEKELSILARLGSGSACRSIPDGYVEWVAGNSSENSYAKTIFPASWWEIIDIVVVVSSLRKHISTSQGQKLATTSQFFPTRLDNIGKKIQKIKDYIRDKNFLEFGELIEAEALELHAIMLTSKPSLIYWLPQTLNLMRLVQSYRLKDKLPVYFTLNTGQDIHLICEKKTVTDLIRKLKTIKDIKNIIINTPEDGVKISQDHLF